MHSLPAGQQEGRIAIVASASSISGQASAGLTDTAGTVQCSSSMSENGSSAPQRVGFLPVIATTADSRADSSASMIVEVLVRSVERERLGSERLGHEVPGEDCHRIGATALAASGREPSDRGFGAETSPGILSPMSHRRKLPSSSLHAGSGQDSLPHTRGKWEFLRNEWIGWREAG
jgi:hypothetical protein